MRAAWCCFIFLGGALLIADVAPAAPPFVEEVVLAVPRPWVNNVTNENSYVSMAVDASGLPHIVFHVPTRAVYHAMRTASGWQIERVDSAVAANPDTSRFFGTHARIAFDDLDRAHVAYVHNGFRNGFSISWKQIFYRRQTAAGFGQPWTTRESTNPGQGFVNLGSDLSLGVSPDGSRAYIVTNRAGSTPPVIYQERVIGGWTPPFDPAFPYTATLQDLVVTPDGVPWISSNTGNSTGDVVVGRVLSNAWLTELAGESSIATNPNGRLAVHGAAGDDLYMCYEAQAHRVGVRTRVNGEWLDLVSGKDPGPIIPTFGGLRLASPPSGWAPWILSSRGNGGVLNGALLSASSTLTPGQWSTIDVSDVPGPVALAGNAWISVGAPNRVHVVYQVLDNTGSNGLQLRYAVFDAPGPPTLAVDPRIQAPKASLHLEPDVVFTTTSTRIRLSLEGISKATLTVHDLSGRAVASREVASIPVPGTTISWDLGAQTPGVYFMQMRYGSSQITKRFIVL